MSNQLIPVFTATIGDTPVNAIDARALHEFLEVRTRFNDWIIRRIGEYNAELTGASGAFAAKRPR